VTLAQAPSLLQGKSYQDLVSSLLRGESCATSDRFYAENLLLDTAYVRSSFAAHANPDVLVLLLLDIRRNAVAGASVLKEGDDSGILFIDIFCIAPPYRAKGSTAMTDQLRVAGPFLDAVQRKGSVWLEGRTHRPVWKVLLLSVQAAVSFYAQHGFVKDTDSAENGAMSRLYLSSRGRFVVLPPNVAVTLLPNVTKENLAATLAAQRICFGMDRGNDDGFLPESRLQKIINGPGQHLLLLVDTQLRQVAGMVVLSFIPASHELQVELFCMDPRYRSNGSVVRLRGLKLAGPFLGAAERIGAEWASMAFGAATELIELHSVTAALNFYRAQGYHSAARNTHVMVKQYID